MKQLAENVTFGGNGIAGSGADFSLTSCARDLASGVSSTLGGWVVVKQPHQLRRREAKPRFCPPAYGH